MNKVSECLKFVAAAGAGTMVGMSLISGACLTVLGLCMNSGYINCSKVGLTCDVVSCAGTSAAGILLIGATFLSALKISGDKYSDAVRDTSAFFGLGTAMALPLATLFYSMATIPAGEAHNRLEDNIKTAVSAVSSIQSKLTPS